MRPVAIPFVAMGLGAVMLALSAKRRAAAPAYSPLPPGAPRPDLVPFGDQRRLKTLDGLTPAARPEFEALMRYAAAAGMQPSIVSALRTCEEEANLKATKARKSWHCLGRAVDIELHGRVPDGEAPDYLYERLGTWWEARGGNWGGRWKSLYPSAPGVTGASGDPMHFQWSGGSDVVPASIWPDGADCTTVVDAYLRSEGAPWTPSGGWQDARRLS